MPVTEKREVNLLARSRELIEFILPVFASQLEEVGVVSEAQNVSAEHAEISRPAPVFLSVVEFKTSYEELTAEEIPGQLKSRLSAASRDLANPIAAASDGHRVTFFRPNVPRAVELASSIVRGGAGIALVRSYNEALGEMKNRLIAAYSVQGEN